LSHSLQKRDGEWLKVKPQYHKKKKKKKEFPKEHGY
jgi:hypothetical protein